MQCTIINNDTGEVITDKHIILTSEEELNRVRSINYLKERTEFEKLLIDKLGYFYFIFYNNLPCTLEKQYKFRFIYLCTYLKYDDTRLMYKVNNTRYELIKEGDLMSLLKLGDREYYKTKKVLIDNNLIHVDNEKNVHINNNISSVGAVGNSKEDYTRIFKRGIQELYNKSTAREHKKLALFIELLPFIHYKYNVICNNPHVELMQDIEPITLNELSNIFKSYNNSNIYSLKKQLLNTFVNNKKLIMIIEDYNKKFFVVNPLIYYKGNDLKELTYLINLFKI